MGRTWTAVSVTATAELAEGVASFLLDCGAPGLHIEELDGATRLTAHYAESAPLAAVHRYCDRLHELFPHRARPVIEVAAVGDEAWAENWRAHFPPLRVGQRLFVHAPWVDDVPSDRIPIVLDPGMAFGTGHHASTRGCLELLEPALASHPAARVLDLGTGSGILAIAAAKLGAASVWAIDTDPQACAVAEQNAIANGVRDALRFAPDLGAAAGPFDIALANLFAAQLIEYAPTLAAALTIGGTAIGAGILAAEADGVRAAWRGAGLTAERDWIDEGWMALASRRVS